MGGSVASFKRIIGIFLLIGFIAVVVIWTNRESRIYPLKKIDPHLVAQYQSTAPIPMPTGEGLGRTRQGPFSPIEFLVNTWWTGIFRGELTMVYAGETGDEVKVVHVGGVRIYAQNYADTQIGRTRYLGQVLTSHKSPLTIVNKKGDILILKDSSGRNYWFDLRTLKLIEVQKL